MNVSKDFEELFKCLNGRGVKALVVGAHAVAFHAKPRYTKDLDLLVEPSAENAVRIVEALKDFGFGSLSLTANDFDVPDKVVWIGVAPNRVDLITSITGVTFEKAWADRVTSRYGSQTVAYISKADLIRNKKACGRPQDLIDVEWLTASEERR